MTDERIWYLYTAEGQAGPYTAEELRAWRAAGSITDEWYVWREGMAEWTQLGKVPELAGAPAPPAPPAAPESPPAGETKRAAEEAPAAAEAETEEAKPAKKEKPARRGPSRGLFVALAVILVLGGGAVAALYFVPMDSLLALVGLAPPPPPPVPQPALDLGADEEEPAEPPELAAAREVLARLAETNDPFDLLGLATAESAETVAARIVEAARRIDPEGARDLTPGALLEMPDTAVEIVENLRAVFAEAADTEIPRSPAAGLPADGFRLREVEGAVLATHPDRPALRLWLRKEDGEWKVAFE